MSVLGRIETQQFEGNYSGGSFPSTLSPSNSIPFITHPSPFHPKFSRHQQKSGSAAAEVVYTQVGASIKETVRGHSRQIELCSVAWVKVQVIQLAQAGQGVKEGGGKGRWRG